jgi:hypothetical protein
MLPTIATGNVGSALAGEYEVANSLRFDDGSTDYLSRSLGSSETSTQIGTFSFWLKRGSLSGVTNIIYSNEVDDTDNRGYFAINSDNTFLIVDTLADVNHLNFKTNRLARDVSAWYHFVLSIDTTQSTASDRAKLYINGVQETSFSIETYPSQNANLKMLTGGQTNKNYIGNIFGASAYFDGYMAEAVYIDGQQLDPTSFGEFDEVSGIWKPIDVSGLTFGNNGFYLDFENSGSLGADVSGNGNNFTVNNLTSIDQSTDTCTNNFCTLNPLTKSSATFSEGNLKQGGAGASAVATFGVSSGKWYFEQKILGGNNEAHLGFALENSGIFKDNVTGSTVRGSGYVSLYSFDGKIYNEGSATSSFGTFSANDIVGFALDVDAGDIFLYQNGTVLNSGSAVVSGKTGKTWFPFGNFDAGNVTGIEHNFGGTQTFTISSGNSDGNGYGNFEYSVPSGYYALNTKNLAEYG